MNTFCPGRAWLASLLRSAALAVVILMGSASIALAAGVQERTDRFRSGGKAITVESYLPEGAGKYPAVLVLYSAAGTLVGKADLERFSRTLASRGMAAFIVHYFNRTGTVFAGNGAIARFPAVWTETVGDAITHVSAHPSVDPRRIGLFGYSLGAYIAVAESSRDPRVDVVAEVAGGIFDGFGPRMQRLPPTLILHGRNDERVPVARAFDLARAGRRLGTPPIVKIYEGQGHRLAGAAAQDAEARALSFLGKYLLRP